METNLFTILSKVSTELRTKKSGKSNLIDKKNRWKNGMKTQIIDDSRGITVACGYSVGANNYDGHHLRDSLLINDENALIGSVFTKHDNITYDNHFSKVLKEFVIEHEEEGFSSKNLTKPIQKKKIFHLQYGKKE